MIERLETDDAGDDVELLGAADGLGGADVGVGTTSG